MILKVGSTSVQYSDSVMHKVTSNSINCCLNGKLRANEDYNKCFCCECVKNKKLAGTDVS